MKEMDVITSLQQAALPMWLPKPVDLRLELPRNPNHQWKVRDVSKIKGLVWHQELGWGTVEAVANYHASKHNFQNPGIGVQSISYTWAIRRDGQIVLCNGFSAKPWSHGTRDRVGDENAEFMSVMFEGHFNGTGHTAPDAGEPTQEQMLAALLLWRVCAVAWGWDHLDLYGHYHFGKPACPGYTPQAVIEAFRLCPPDGWGEADDTPMHLLNLESIEGRQSALIDLKYLPDGSDDGIWGPVSKGALIQFQARNSLVADGAWGKQTEAAIMSALVE